MAVVYRAHQRRLGRSVAVKLIAPALDVSDTFRARFAREARMMARLVHPNIAAIYDFGEVDGTCYLVMELVEGRPLSQCLPLPMAEAIRMIDQVADALAHAHALGIIHRDVKPSNVLVREDGVVKLADFGIARLIPGDADAGTMTAGGGTPGTPSYMSPEALAGAPPDPRMDVYALAVLLHQTITGRLPVGEIVGLPSRIRAVVRRGLAADPARRHPTIRAFQRDLARCSGRSRSTARAAPWLLAIVGGVAAVSSSATTSAGRPPPRKAAIEATTLSLAAPPMPPIPAPPPPTVTTTPAPPPGIVTRRSPRPRRRRPVATEPAATAVALNASIRVRAIPWAAVNIDGRSAGIAELSHAAFSVRPGDHEVVLRNPVSGQVRRRQVAVRAGEQVSLTVDMREVQ